MTNRGSDLIGVKNMCQKHQALMAELAGHEPRIRKTCNEAEDMIQRAHFASGDVKRRVVALQGKWQTLRDKVCFETFFQDFFVRPLETIIWFVLGFFKTFFKTFL